MGARVDFVIGKLLRDKGFDRTTDMCLYNGKNYDSPKETFLDAIEYTLNNFIYETNTNSGRITEK